MYVCMYVCVAVYNLDIWHDNINIVAVIMVKEAI